MSLRREALSEVQNAHRALAEGRYDVAFALLERAARRRQARTAQAQLNLYLAATYALYGEDGLDGGLFCLKEAAALDSSVQSSPLYRALYWEFAAYRGDAAADVIKGAVAATETGEAFSAHHAAAALVHVEAYREALELLAQIDFVQLPDYLLWRAHSLRGRALEAQDDWLEAAEAYEQSSQLSTGIDQQGEYLNFAASLLEAGMPQEALSTLAVVDETILTDPSDRSVKAYLEGRVHLLLNNPNEALLHFTDAEALEREADEETYNLKLILAQTYAMLGQYRFALLLYERAVALAPDEQRAFALHEYAFVLNEADLPLEAKDKLLEAARDPDYDFRAQIYADLADAEYRLGNLIEAQDLAMRALDLGAEASSRLLLAQIANEYFRFDEALTHLEYAMSSATKGEADWLSAKCMLADVLAQQGFSDPERILLNAQGALEYLPESDEWTLILRDYAARAQALLNGHTRLLN